MAFQKYNLQLTSQELNKSLQSNSLFLGSKKCWYAIMSLVCNNLFRIGTWNPKQPFIDGCFSWMIPNLYIENGCFTKHPFINGCLGFQGVVLSLVLILVINGIKIYLSIIGKFFSQDLYTMHLGINIQGIRAGYNL